MKFFLSLLVAFSTLSVGESWTASDRITGLASSRSPGTQKPSTQLHDLIDGYQQWYTTTSSTNGNVPSQAVTKDAVNRKLKAAAERFMKFQSGYFSPMTPNNNMINMNSRMGMTGLGDRTNNMNSNYNYNYNNGYNNNGYNNGYNNNGFNNYYNNPYDPSNILADDFVFTSPVIGPLNKKDYIGGLGYFKVYEAFPDINPNCYGFTVDLINPLKVRFFVKASGTYQYKLGGLLGKLGAKPDGRQYMGSTEAWSITFNDLDRMQVKSISAGYVVDRFEEKRFCTTDGKGLTLGVLHTIGVRDLPTDPSSSLRWFSGLLASGESDSILPRTFTKSKELPPWWNQRQ